MGTAGRPLYSSQPSSASAEAAGWGHQFPKCWGQEPKHSRLPEGNANCVGWSCWPCCQFVQPLSRCSSWLGAASAGFSPQQPAGHLGAEAQLWGKPLVPTLLLPALSFPLVFPSSPSISLPFLGSHLLSSSCSCAAWLLASTLRASQFWLLTASTKVTPHWGHPMLGQSCHRVRSGQ